MKNISETRTLSTIHLSDTQKSVLSKIIGSATPETAIEEISDGRNMVAARDILQDLKLIDFDERRASVTDEGREVMRDENLIDGSDQLTQDGQQYSQTDKPGEMDDQEGGMADPGIEGPEGQEDPMGADPMAGEEPDMGMDGQEGEDDDLSLESKIPMISGMNRYLTESIQLKNLKRAD